MIWVSCNLISVADCRFSIINNDWFVESPAADDEADTPDAETTHNLQQKLAMTNERSLSHDKFTYRLCIGSHFMKTTYVTID